jgi:hypothetical protein
VFLVKLFDLFLFFLLFEIGVYLIKLKNCYCVLFFVNTYSEFNCFENFLELSADGINNKDPIFMSENTRNIKNREINFTEPDSCSKEFYSAYKSTLVRKNFFFKVIRHKNKNFFFCNMSRFIYQSVQNKIIKNFHRECWHP